MPNSSSSPLVSIIIPAYNSQLWIAECIDSCLAQTYRNYEIIVINDCSTDATSEILKTYQERGAVHLIEHDQNKDVAESRNDGLNASSGDYIVFLDSDDMLCINHIDTMVQALMSANADLAIGNWVIFGDNLAEYEATHHALFLHIKNPIARLFRRLTVLSGYIFKKSSVRWRTDYFQKSREVDRYVVDFILAGHHQLVFVNNIVVRIRVHTSPNRRSLLYGENEPLYLLNLWSEFRLDFLTHGMLDHELECSIQILMLRAACSYAFKYGRKFPNDLVANVNVKILMSSDIPTRDKTARLATLLGLNNTLLLFSLFGCLNNYVQVLIVKICRSRGVIYITA